MSKNLDCIFGKRKTSKFIGKDSMEEAIVELELWLKVSITTPELQDEELNVNNRFDRLDLWIL